MKLKEAVFGQRNDRSGAIKSGGITFTFVDKDDKFKLEHLQYRVGCTPGQLIDQLNETIQGLKARILIHSDTANVEEVEELVV